MLEKIGVATSIFSEKSFDPFKTIEFLKDNGLKTIQLYMDERLQNDREKTEELNKALSENDLEILCHSPYSLNKSILDGTHIAALDRVYPKNKKLKIVIHFDEKATLKEALEVTKKLNKSGVTVCLENFYIEKNRFDLIANVEKYLSFFEEAVKLGLDVIPVFDIPRLFIKDFEDIDALFLTEQIFYRLSLSLKNIILHLIDTSDIQQRREDWRAIGEGTINYDEIFESIKRYNLVVDSAIMEYETVELATDSIKELDRLLSL